jgi:restriction system protein
MARRQSFFDDFMDIGSKIGWRAASIAAAISFIILHLIVINTEAVPAPSTLSGLGASVQHAQFHDIALFAQYLLPVGLLIGAAVGFVKQRQSISLFKDARDNPATSITQLSWQAFERLVGEAFRQRGYKVTEFGGTGPDGGVDLGLSKNGERRDAKTLCEETGSDRTDIRRPRVNFSCVVAKFLGSALVVESHRQSAEILNHVPLEPPVLRLPVFFRFLFDLRRRDHSKLQLISI